MAPAAAAATQAHAVRAAASSTTATYHATATHLTRLAVAKGSNWGHFAGHAATATGKPREAPWRSPGGPYPAGKGGASHAASLNVARAAGYTAGSSGVSVVHAFNGISDNDNASLNGFHETPPDQGLCLSHLTGFPGTTQVVEMVNSVVLIATPAGVPLSEFTLADASADPNASGDMRCLVDPKTKILYLTQISFDSLGNTLNDVTVVRPDGAFVTYQFDSSQGGTCFGDQPKTGFDNNALIISTDQYCPPTANNVTGALVLAISKPQLNALGPPPNSVVFGPVSLGGIPGLGLDPAINTGTGTSYLVNSFPFDANGSPNSISHSLGFWKLTGDHALNSGSGTITLTGKVIGSETYAFPVPAGFLA
jgi:hypothetical protein